MGQIPQNGWFIMDILLTSIYMSHMSFLDVSKFEDSGATFLNWCLQEQQGRTLCRVANVDADAHIYVDDPKKFGNGFLIGIEYDRIIFHHIIYLIYLYHISQVFRKSSPSFQRALTPSRQIRWIRSLRSLQSLRSPRMEGYLWLWLT